MVYEPLKLLPCCKEYIWGGTQLKKMFAIENAPEVVAESWVLADHEDGHSAIASEPFMGKTMTDLGTVDRKAFWGMKCAEHFPLMVKLIDAAKNLSIQVHPSDRTAKPANGEQGKAEMWYIVDCKPQSYIYLGFSHATNRDEVEKRAKDGTICEMLNKVNVKKGDIFYIPPGTVHGICEGIMIAEIQQSSNTTFRVYDYERRGADGKLRPLHLKRALDVMNYKPTIPQKCRGNGSVVFPAFSLVEMFACDDFQAYRLDIHTKIDLCCNGNSFNHLLCIDGSGEIKSARGQYPISMGDSYFIPAAAGEYSIEGECRILLSKI